MSDGLSPTALPKEKRVVKILGTLLFADARGTSNEIRIIAEDGEHKVKVVPEMMDDIVRPLWNSVVSGAGRTPRQGGYADRNRCRVKMVSDRPCASPWASLKRQSLTRCPSLDKSPRSGNVGYREAALLFHNLIPPRQVRRSVPQLRILHAPQHAPVDERTFRDGSRRRSPQPPEAGSGNVEAACGIG